MGPTWGPSGADRTQVGLMLAPWTLLYGITTFVNWTHKKNIQWNCNQNTSFFSQRNAFENYVCNIVYILFQPQFVSCNGLDNGLLLDSSKPITEPILSNHHEGLMAYTCSQFHRKRLKIYILHMSLEIDKFKIISTSTRGPCVKVSFISAVTDVLDREIASSPAIWLCVYCLPSQTAAIIHQVTHPTSPWQLRSHRCAVWQPQMSIVIGMIIVPVLIVTLYQNLIAVAAAKIKGCSLC